jgi:hypothetical protein
MGILDDAIREHLDLKRRQGAEEDELQRLEGEAFGPPTRPGDPDFPEEQPAAEAALAPPAEEPTSEEPLAEAPATAEEPAAPPADESAAAGFFDQSSDELDLDMDLTLADEGAQVAETGEQAVPPPPEPAAAPPEPEPVPPETGETPAPAPEPPATDERAAVEPPVESLDTVEHPFEGEVEDTGEAELVEGEITEEGDGSKEEEDVLEETPEFLRDAPEDDELWFEQGEPKDFDF